MKLKGNNKHPPLSSVEFAILIFCLLSILGLAVFKVIQAMEDNDKQRGDHGEVMR